MAVEHRPITSVPAVGGVTAPLTVGVANIVSNAGTGIAVRDGSEEDVHTLALGALPGLDGSHVARGGRAERRG